MPTEHVDQLNREAGALLEYETLTSDEIKQVAASQDIDRPDAEASPVRNYPLAQL